jgi:hypothetical protein
MGWIRIKRETLERQMRLKDIWFLRALMLAERLKGRGLAIQDVLDEKRKNVLFEMYEKERGT